MDPRNDAYLKPLRITPLEERILLDAAAAADIATQAAAQETDHQVEKQAQQQQEQNQNKSESQQADHQADNKSTENITPQASSDSSSDILHTQADSSDQSVKVIVLSSQVKNVDILAQASQDNVKVVTYDASKVSLTDIVSQISQALNGAKADSIAFISYGSDAEFSLTDSKTMSMQGLQSDSTLQSFWKDVSSLVKNDGRIDLLACNVGSSDSGNAFIQSLDTFVDDSSSDHFVSIAASTDLTGSSEFGGDWQLEIGNVNAAQTYFNDTLLSNWHGVLDNTAYLIDDIVSGSGSSNPSNFVNVDGTLFFTATTSANGTELWKSDGTAEGTTLVKDIRSGTTSSSPTNLTNVDGVLFFTATNGTNGVELWKSDGTSSGTMMVKDIYAGSTSSSPTKLTNVDGTLYFSATTSANGAELWKSDGTSDGTVLVKDIRTGTTGSSLNNFSAFDNKLYFTANNGSSGQELWVSDGTSAGTVLLKDINSGSASSSPANFTIIGSTLYFSATTSGAGIELWKTDGTASGTVIVKDIQSGTGSSSPTSMINANGTLYFVATTTTSGAELWKSDGTSAGTVMVKDIFSGATGATITDLEYMNGHVYFSATDGTTGIELYRSGGNSWDTTLVANINATTSDNTSSSTPSNKVVIGDTMYFTATNGTDGVELWKTDGTSWGTSMVTDIYTGLTSSNPTSLTVIGNMLFFGATSSASGTELWGLEHNSAPVNTATTASQTINEDASLTLNAANNNQISVYDADGSNLTVTLTVANGTMSLSTTAGLTFTTGNGIDDSVIVMSGTQAALNAALNNLVYLYIRQENYDSTYKLFLRYWPTRSAEIRPLLSNLKTHQKDEFMYFLCDQISESNKQNDELSKRVSILETEIKYMPGNEGYQEAEEHFQSLIS